MYGGRIVPSHSFDHTRRYQNDIVVYSENELRAAIGYVKPGSRIVIASEISITKTVEVKIAQDLNPIEEIQDVIVTGFGSGKLTRKANVTDSFDMFKLVQDKPGGKIAERAGIIFQDLNFDGFIHAVMIGQFIAPGVGGSFPAYVKSLQIRNCTLQNCHALLGAANTGLASTRSTIWGLELIGNRLYSTETVVAGVLTRDCRIIDPSYSPAYGTIEIKSGVIFNNHSLDKTGNALVFSEETTLAARVSDCEISSNLVSGTVDLSCLQNIKVKANSSHRLKLADVNPIFGTPNWVEVEGNYVEDTTTLNLHYSSLVGNVMRGIITNDPNSTNLKVIGNQFESFVPLAANVFPNAECCIVRNNIGTGGRDVNGHGRISIPGEILGQTIFDTRTAFPPALPFLKVVTSSTYEILDNDTNPANVAEVSFHVPCNRLAIIRLHCHIRDIQTATPPNFDQLFFEIRQSTGAINGANCNVEQAFYYGKNTGAAQVTNGFMPVTFEWFIDGNPGAWWTAGQAVTIEVWTRVASAGMKLEIWGGQGVAPIPPVSDGTTQYAGPLKLEVEAVSDDLVSTIPS